MQLMDVWQVMDYIVEYANSETKTAEEAQSGSGSVRRARQDDFDNF